MTTTQQLEIRFPNSGLSPAARRRRQPNERARWWFTRMRLEAERALSDAGAQPMELENRPR